MASEAVVSQQFELLAAYHGVFWRNNVGACTDVTGRVIRYGLANESAQANERVKSSDWIGITPVIVTPGMIGHRVGIFTAPETKHSGWHLTPGDKHGQAQAAFHDIVRAHGGIAGFVTCNDDYLRMIGR